MNETGADQAIKLLQKMSDVDPNTVKYGINPNGLIEVVSAAFINDKENGINIKFQNGKAVEISFYYDKEIPLSDAIQYFGTPKYIYIFAISGDHASLLTVDFEYPDQGICLHHQNRGLILELPKTYRLRATTNITEIYYVDPSLPQRQTAFGCLSGGNEHDLKSIQLDWKGYGKYQIPKIDTTHP